MRAQAKSQDFRSSIANGLFSKRGSGTGVPGYRPVMEDTLCHISAFRFYRIPPQVLPYLPPIPIEQADQNRVSLLSSLAVTDCIGNPRFLISDSRNHTGARRIKHHQWRGHLPAEAIIESDLGVQVTSPLFTLLQLAGSVDDIELLMALYEICGSFAIFKPSSRIEALLAQASSHRALGTQGWTRVTDSRGTPSPLWMRPPLIELDELQRFLELTEGAWGHKRLARAASYLTGIVASPLEAQLSMLLGLPRCRGGEGLRRIETNVDMPLSRTARKLHPKNKVIIDAYLTSTDGSRALALECQGRAVHGMGGVSDGDANRATALQSMGIEVLLVTSEQLSQKDRYDALVRTIFAKLGMKQRPKTAAQKRAEVDLRRKIFGDWGSFGSQFD